MISFLKKLWRDRRGNALIIAGAAMPLIVGSAGLATDTVQWALWKRELQRAADSAAIAGVYARFQDQDVESAVDTDLDKNNHTWASLVAGYPDVSMPANTTQFMNAVEVDLAVQKSLGFTSMFMSAAPIITTTARAAAVDDGTFCVVALDNSANSAITIQGSATARLGCGAISNSVSSTQAVDVNGSSYTFVAEPVASVGGLPSSIIGATDLQPYHLAQPDPFDDLYATDVPAGMNCTPFSQKVRTVTTGTGQNRVTMYHLSAGCFTSFNPGNQVYNLDPGVYYLQNTNFTANGNMTLIGTDVTFILTGTNPGSLQTNGSANLQLTAPTTGTYARMLFIQSDNASSANNNTVNGSSTSSFDGAFYFPRGRVNFTGSNSSSTQCTMVVAFQVEFSGSSILQNDTSTCVADQTVTGKKVRLIA